MTSTRARFLVRLLPGLLLCAACGDGAPSTADANAADVSFDFAAAADADAPPPVADRPNLVVFLIDTQRADFLGTYGHPQPTSPQLDAFAREGMVFEAAFAQASSTSPSHASLFTSTYPRTHGVWNRVVHDVLDDPVHPALADSAVTLAEALAEHGYDTAGIADGGNVQASRGFAQGFRVWDSDFRGADHRVDRAVRWLDSERDPAKPFFLFLHTYQVHTPYVPERQYVELFADPDYDGPLRAAWEGARAYWEENIATLRGAIGDIQSRFYKPHIPKEDGTSLPPADLAFLKALYEAEIRQTDAAFARFLAALDERGLDENTLILVTSDHGEEFWEHGKYGHHQIYDHTVHVPFFVRGPGVPAGARRSDPVELLDVMPTLLRQAGVERALMPPAVVGRVLDLGRADSPADDHVVVAETNWPEAQIAWRHGARKAMLFPESERPAEVYRWRDDPLEQDDLAAREAAWLEAIRPPVADWKQSADAWQAQQGLQPGVRGLDRLSPAEQAQLQALGYGDGIFPQEGGADPQDEDAGDDDG